MNFKGNVFQWFKLTLDDSDGSLFEWALRLNPVSFDVYVAPVTRRSINLEAMSGKASNTNR